MGDLLQNLALGFSVALSFHNLGLALIGCLLGSLIGLRRFLTVNWKH